MAPCSVLLAGKVLDREGNGDVENVISGIQWLKNVKDQFGVRIVNISVGTQPDLGDAQKQSLLEAVESLWDLGIVVVVSAGNYGPEAGSVAVPGNSRKVITVGVPDSVRPAVYCRREKMNYSGRGPTKECVIKPDVFAPGTGIISCNSRYKQPGEHLYSIKSGTSMAAPVVSGAAACLLSKYPDMTNVEVKLRLRESCVKYPGTEAGWGLLNVKKLMNATENEQNGTGQDSIRDTANCNPGRSEIQFHYVPEKDVKKKYLTALPLSCMIPKVTTMNEILEQALLYDFYGELLTAHQKDIYEQFVLDDLSLSEIAEMKGISRQGVHDLVKRCQKTLEGYESKLHLVEKFLSVKEKVGRIDKILDECESGKKKPEEIVKSIRQISDAIIEEL